MVHGQLTETQGGNKGRKKEISPRDSGSRTSTAAAGTPARGTQRPATSPSRPAAAAAAAAAAVVDPLPPPPPPKAPQRRPARAAHPRRPRASPGSACRAWWRERAWRAPTSSPFPRELVTRPEGAPFSGGAEGLGGSIRPARRRAESFRVEWVWVLRRSGVRRAKAGERYMGWRETRGARNLWGCVLTCSSHFAHLERRNVFFVCVEFLFLDTWKLLGS